MSKYELRISKTCGDVIPLVCVAEAMARASATAYGHLPLHKPAFDGSLRGYVATLLAEARAGRLAVCNQFGASGTVNDLVEAAENSGNLSKVSRYLVEPDWDRLHRDNLPIAEGVWDLCDVDLGPSETDWDTTHLLCLYAKLHHLNEWGNTRGDVFSISDEWIPWCDERGLVTDPNSEGEQQSDQNPQQDAIDRKHWIDRNKVMAYFEINTDSNENEKFWDDKLGKPPAWLKDARMFAGKPGNSALWDPLLIANSLLGHKSMNLRQLDTAIDKHFPELMERWKEQTEDQRQ